MLSGMFWHHRKPKLCQGKAENFWKGSKGHFQTSHCQWEWDWRFDTLCGLQDPASRSKVRNTLQYAPQGEKSYKSHSTETAAKEGVRVTPSLVSPSRLQRCGKEKIRGAKWEQERRKEEKMRQGFRMSWSWRQIMDQGTFGPRPRCDTQKHGFGFPYLMPLLNTDKSKEHFWEVTGVDHPVLGLAWGRQGRRRHSFSPCPCHLIFDSEASGGTTLFVAAALVGIAVGGCPGSGFRISQKLCFGELVPAVASPCSWHCHCLLSFSEKSIVRL